MKTVISKINNKNLLYSFIVFLLIVLSIPLNSLGINIMNLSVEPSLTAFISFSAIVALSVLGGVITQRIIASNNGALIPFVALLYADPLIRCSFFQISHLIVLILAAAAVLFLVTKVSAAVKFAAVAVFAFISALILPESVFSTVAIVLIVYITLCLPRQASESTKTSKKQTEAKEPGAKLWQIFIVIALTVSAYFLNEKITAHLYPLKSVVYNPLSTSLSLASVSFWGCAVPYIVILIVFLVKYFAFKKEAGRESPLKTSPLLWLTALAYVAIILSAAIFNHPESLTFFNALTPITIMLIFASDKEDAEKTAQRIYSAAAKHKYLLIFIAVVVFWLMHQLSKEIQESFFDQLAFTTGTLL